MYLYGSVRGKDTPGVLVHTVCRWHAAGLADNPQVHNSEVYLSVLREVDGAGTTLV